MRLQHDEAERVDETSLDYRRQLDDVAERLRHLFAFDSQHAVVNPEPGERSVSEERFRLGDLILVVGEDQVGASAVDVDCAAEVVGAHGGALDVPAWASVTPWARPGWLTRLGCLPKGEVKWIVLALIDLNSRPGTEIVGISARKLAIVRE